MTQPATGRAARLEDVAALAGVSLATASKALHNKPRISEETKQRVLDAAKQLNYSPNKLAQSLARGTTGTIGLVTSDLQGRFSTPILIGAENELRAQSTSVLLANARGDAALERQHVEKLLSLKVDGLLIVQCETNPRPTLGHDWGVPLVYVYGPSTDTEDCSVTCDNVDAGRMAINHLISCGRRHIAIIGGDETYTAATDRTKGALEALAELGIEPAGQSGTANGTKAGAAPPPACCSIRASRLTLWSAKTTSWPEAALTCSNSRGCAFRMTSPLSATITGLY